MKEKFEEVKCSEKVIMRNFSLLILLFSLGAVAVSGKQSEPSCEESRGKELVCSQEVLEAIKREEAGLPPLPPKPIQKPAEPVVVPVDEGDGGEDGEDYDDEYYDDEYYDDEYYDG